MRTIPFLVVLAISTVAVVAEEGKYRTKSEKTAPPEELSAAVRAVLMPTCEVVSDVAGNAICEVWFRDELPGKGNADQLKNGLTYREIPETTIVAAVRFPKLFIDFRKQEIPAGTYTLRLAFQPDTGDHTGTAPHTEFGLLSPAAKDTDVAELEVKAMYKMSLGATGGDHPGVVLLYPYRGTEAEAIIADRGDSVRTLNVRRPIATDAGRSTIGVAITVSGHSKTR